MENNFSLFEQRLIRMQMQIVSGAEIADMISRPVSEVNHQIQELTGGLPSGYELLQIKKANKVISKKAATINKQSLNTIKKVSYRKVKVVEKKFATRVIDTSHSIAVRIDHKTIIYVKPGTDIEKIKEKFRNRTPDYLKPESPSTPVKKFKQMK